MARRISSSRKKWWNGTCHGTIYRVPGGEVACMDALKFLHALTDSCADIIFLDPPFNLGKQYGEVHRVLDQIEVPKYKKYLTNVIWRCVEVLKPGGSLFLYHLPKWAIRLGDVLEQELTFRHWIAVCMKNGFVRGDYLHPAHYALLYYTKGKPQHFRRPKVPIAMCRHCKKSVKDYGGYKSYVADGVNLSDVWEDLSPVRHQKYKHRASNELPLRMLERVVKIAGMPGGLLVDPFAGSGTSLVAAKAHAMNFVGNDIVHEYCKTIVKRLSKEQGVRK